MKNFELLLNTKSVKLNIFHECLGKKITIFAKTLNALADFSAEEIASQIFNIETTSLFFGGSLHNNEALFFKVPQIEFITTHIYHVQCVFSKESCSQHIRVLHYKSNNKLID